MASYGQFCAIARAHEILGGRWTILIVRELLCGSRRFNDILRGLPRISRTVLSERLQALAHAGAVMRVEGESGPEYHLTEAGRELSDVIKALAIWGQRRLPRDTSKEYLDIEPVLVDMERRVRFDRLPPHPVMVRFELTKIKPRFLLLRKIEAVLCVRNEGYPEPVRVVGPLSALAAWWRGDVSFASAEPGAWRRGNTGIQARFSGLVRALCVCPDPARAARAGTAPRSAAPKPAHQWIKGKSPSGVTR